jgi:hypothetical protein
MIYNSAFYLTTYINLLKVNGYLRILYCPSRCSLSNLGIIFLIALYGFFGALFEKIHVLFVKFSFTTSIKQELEFF